MRALTFLIIAALAATACKSGTETSPTPTPPRGEFTITDLTVGTGVEAVNGRNVTVTYALWLYDPTRVDGKGQQIPQSAAPFSFVLGTGNVIQGWHRGVVGMRVGGRRRLLIPPELAYGAQSPGGGIPPNATLVFDIELLNVQ